jgi:hypothetical protein
MVLSPLHQLSCSCATLVVMRSGRDTLALLAVGLVAIPLLPNSASAAPTLVGTTSIAGDRTGYSRVELTKPLKPFSHNDKPRIRLEGGGAILGIVLRTEHAIDNKHTTLEILRVDRQNQGSPILYSVGNGEDGLPAGAYRLYLIAERPGRVTLEFPSLREGELSLAPAVHTPFDAGPLPRRTWPVPGTTPFGRTGEVVSDGMVFSRAIVDDAPPGSRLETCFYANDEEDAAGDRAYGPGCPGGRMGYTQTATSTGDIGHWAMTSANSPGRIGHGGNVTTAADAIAEPVALNTFAMWMSYELPAAAHSPPPGPLPPPAAERDGTVTFSSRRLKVRNGTVRVPLRCSPEGACRGRIRLTGARKTVGFALPSGARRTFKIPLSRSMRRRVRSHRHVRGRIVVVSNIADRRRELRGEVTLVRATR